MPKPKSPDRPKKKFKFQPKVEPKSQNGVTAITDMYNSMSLTPNRRKVEPKARVTRTAPARQMSEHVGNLAAPAEDRFDDDVPDVPSSRVVVDPPNAIEDRQRAKVRPAVYPTLIRELLSICMSEASDVRVALKNRNRQRYKNIFDSYKDNLSPQDYSIVKSALFYLYEFSRVNSIDKDTAIWMIGIYDIPTSQIVSYTSKEVLRSIAKERGLSYSNKKAEELVENIRGVIDPSQ